MYSGRLGIAPAIIAAAIPAVENLFKSIFGGSSETLEAGVTQEIQGDLSTVMADLGHIATPGTAAYDKFTKMRCLAGDQSVNALAQDPAIFGPFPVPPGCGYAHQDSRNYARTAVLTAAATAAAQGVPGVQTVFQFLNDVPTGSVTSMSATSGMAITSGGTSTTPGGTLPVNVGGGLTLGLPVGVGSLLNAQIFGVPVLAVGAGVVALAFAFGGKRRR